MLLYTMLYIVLAYLMLFAALTNSVCLNNASFFFLFKYFLCQGYELSGEIALKNNHYYYYYYYPVCSQKLTFNQKLKFQSSSLPISIIVVEHGVDSTVEHEVSVKLLWACDVPMDFTTESCSLYDMQHCPFLINPNLINQFSYYF